MAEKKISNLYFNLDFEGEETLVETPLNLITEKDILKYNNIFSMITEIMQDNPSSLLRHLSTGFNSIIYNMYMDKYDDEDKSYEKTKAFETFLKSIVLNSKIYYRGKEMSYPEFVETKKDKTAEIMMEFNICFFLAMFIVLSNTLVLKEIKGMTEIQPLVCYVGSSSIGEFRSFLVNMRAETYSEQE